MYYCTCEDITTSGVTYTYGDVIAGLPQGTLDTLWRQGRVMLKAEWEAYLTTKGESLPEPVQTKTKVK